MALEPGFLLQDRYRIICTLGQGGMGAVYQAEDSALDVMVAIKVNFIRGEGSTSQFMREARMLAKLRHPNLPRVIHYFIAEGNEYLVMDYIPGDDLKHMVEKFGKQSVDKVLDWGNQLGDALEYLHKQDPPIFHRDIKPENIKITPDGQAVLVDFGIAKAAYSHQQTQLGARGYTPGYAPPEQYGGGRTGGYTDQYGLAATLYYCLTGTKPLDSVQRVVEQKEMDTVVSYNRTIPLYVSQAIQRGMALNPGDRFSSVHAFVAAINGKIDSEPLPANKSGESQATITAIGGMAASTQMASSFPQTMPRQAGDMPSTQAYQPAQGAQSPVYPVTQAGALPGKKKFPTGVLIGGLAGLLVLAALVIVGVLYLTGNLFASPTEPVLSALNQTQTEEALALPLVSDATETPEDPTEEPTDEPQEEIEPTATLEPTVTLEAIVEETPEPTLTPTPNVSLIGYVAYVSDEGGDGEQIWLMRVGMDNFGNLLSEKEQLTFDEGDKSYPAWTPDGQFLIYSAPGATATEGLNLYRIDINADEMIPVQLTDRRGDEIYASVSVDGVTVAYDNNGRDDGLRQLYFVNIDGTNDRRVSFDFVEHSPEWHPRDANLYYFVLEGSSHKTLYWRNADADSSELRTFDRSTHFGRLGDVHDPTFSPSAEYIAYTQVNGSRTNVWLTEVSAGGANTFQLTNTNTDWYPSFSIDSVWITFTSSRDGNEEIYVMDLAGDFQTNLSNNAGVDKMPAWFPIFVQE
jgi:eukaryotic-like serine/threonine-protein kinase